jgi:hypothetical protein
MEFVAKALIETADVYLLTTTVSIHHVTNILFH